MLTSKKGAFLHQHSNHIQFYSIIMVGFKHYVRKIVNEKT